MNREVINMGRSSSSPLSPAIRVGNTVYCSGQIAVDPTTGQIVGIGIKEQTEQVLKNLKAVLEAADSSLDKVDKATVFITNQKDFEAMNEVYSTFFPDNPPARSTIVVAALARSGLIVEIECIAHV
jgi:2-iminobutanoate/2-iminopropanoate deaminase